MVQMCIYYMADGITYSGIPEEDAVEKYGKLFIALHECVSAATACVPDNTYQKRNFFRSLKTNVGDVRTTKMLSLDKLVGFEEI